MAVRFDNNNNSEWYGRKENVNGINLTSAIIDKIEYHFHDNTFHFIFNVSNNFLSGKSRLTIEVPSSIRKY